MGLETQQNVSGEAEGALGLLHATYSNTKGKSWMGGKLTFLLPSNLTDVFLQFANSSESSIL